MTFDEAYYITVNDKKFEKRQELMDKQIKKYNLDINKYYGVNKNKIHFKNILKHKVLLNMNNVKKNLGSLACYLSHIFLYLKIYKENKNNNKQVFLILEDDCIILPNFKKKLEFFYKYIPKNWDMVWLGYNHFSGKPINKYVGKPKNKSGIGYNSQHHCYLLKKKSIPKILKILLPINFKKFISQDNYLRNNFDKFNAYFVSQRLAFQNMKMISTRTGKKNG